MDGRIYTHRRRGTQQEEEEEAAKEVGYEWALSKQHLEQEVPIGSPAWRKEVCLCVCTCMAMCGGGVDVILRVQLTLKPQHRFFLCCPVSESEAAHVLYRVKVSPKKHLVCFSTTNFT